MPRQIKNPKILEFQKRDLPINSSSLSINDLGELQERKSNLERRIVEGYGVIWGSKNDYGEIFVKGCFAKSISEMGPGSNNTYQIKFRDQHGKACSLFAELKEDDIGLYFKTVSLDSVQWCNDLLVQLSSGTINNFSIGFKHCWDRVEWDDENDALINIEARLFEISAVTIPSDLATYAVRSSEEIEYLQEEVEDFINTLPRSKQLEARKIFTRCMSPIEVSPLEQRSKAPDTNVPTKTGLPLNLLIKKFQDND